MNKLKKTILTVLGLLTALILFIVFAPNQLVKMTLSSPVVAYCSVVGGTYEVDLSNNDEMGIQTDMSSCEVKEKLLKGEEVNYFDPFSIEPIWDKSTLCECPSDSCWNGYRCVHMSDSL